LKEVLEKNRLFIIQRHCNMQLIVGEQNWKDKQCKFYKTQTKGHKKVGRWGYKIKVWNIALYDIAKKCEKVVCKKTMT
jgi:hypothetical protein